MLAAQPEVGLAAVERPLLKKIKNMSAAKPIINRLSLIRDLYASHGASLDGSRGFSADNLAAFLAPLLASPSVEVRHSVVGLLGDLTDDAGVRVRDYLPKDVNPKVLEELEAAARGGGGPKATSGGAGRGRGRGPAPSPGRGPAPSPGRGPAPSPGRGGGGRGPPPGRGGGGRGPAPGRGPPPGRGGGAGGGQRAPEERGRAPPPAEDMPDDPATYERELRVSLDGGQECGALTARP